jgi:hypothetical protein
VAGRHAASRLSTIWAYGRGGGNGSPVSTASPAGPSSVSNALMYSGFAHGLLLQSLRRVQGERVPCALGELPNVGRGEAVQDQPAAVLAL